ncbi:hypothetical protein DPX16_19574 [Anabarilius grahami]|uniref:Uncharacterized protein n=1 Tax=Anabarilius grahami TaxID=495550 RepID=A0A3N0YPX1_ANAGA|nr:hypothetical protein DPX16_19574 [Anabarilius grahami]
MRVEEGGRGLIILRKACYLSWAAGSMEERDKIYFGWSVLRWLKMGRWEEWTQVISRTLGNRGKLKKRGVEKKQGERKVKGGRRKTAHRKSEKEEKETDEADTFA